MGQAYKWLPVVDEALCTGCGQCVTACGPCSLMMWDDIAVLLDPDSCGSEEHCLTACSEDAISMHWVPMGGDQSIGKWMLAPSRR
jgi:ferredoxin